MNALHLVAWILSIVISKGHKKYDEKKDILMSMIMLKKNQPFQRDLLLQDMKNVQVFSSSKVSELFLADVDECDADSSLCANGMCVNNVGTPYTCTCNSGYVVDETGQACSGKIHQAFPIGKNHKQ